MNLPWGNLAPQTDFYGAYMRPTMDRQALQEAMLKNQQMRAQNQFLGPQLQENLIQSQMQNQRERELMPFNIPMAEQELTNKRLDGQLSELDLELKPKEFKMKQQQQAMQQAVQQMQMRKYAAEIEQMRAQNQFLGPQLQENLIQSQMQNQRERELMPFNIPMAEQELTNKRLNGQLSELDLEQMPKEFKMKQQQQATQQAVQQMQMRKYAAEIEQMRNPAAFDPLRDSSGNAKQVAISDWYRSQGKNEQADAIMGSLSGNSDALSTWKSIPQSNRRDLIAGARGLGYDEASAVQFFAEGKTLEDLALAKGVSEEQALEVQRIYGPSPQQINAAQGRMAADVELESLTNDYTEWVAPYIDPLNVGGVSWKEIQEIVMGEGSSKERNKFIAGTMISQELPMLRIRLAQGVSGIEAIREMRENAMVNIVSQKERITPEDFKEINDLVNFSLGKASALSNKSVFNPEGRVAETEEKYGLSKGSNLSNKNAETNYDDMSEDELEELLRENPE